MLNTTRGILDMNSFDAQALGDADSPLLKKRQKNAGAASVLFYEKPIEMVSASGCWMVDAAGTKYLDFYNNVPSVGHCHPHVVKAITDQLSLVNSHSRYLNELTETYVEKLKATFPNELDNVVMTCSGSEANDLAMRIATHNTKAEGFIVTESAYHGNTEFVTKVSPSAFKSGKHPDHVVAIPAPSRRVYGDDVATGFAEQIRLAIHKLQGRGYDIAAFICDSIFSSDGIFSDPEGFLKPAISAVHDAGGLYIADEVQPGFGRTGDCFWGFQRHNVVPDIVTMGKPMGNGYPVAGMAVRSDLLNSFCNNVGYFNTFGGTPVAAAAALSVLEVIEKEDLQHNAQKVGTYLKEKLISLQETDERIGDVRGAGLFIGLDLCYPESQEANGVLASQVINGLRDENILIGAAGPYGHTLKIRPPLCLSISEADLFGDAISRVLSKLK